MALHRATPHEALADFSSSALAHDSDGDTLVNRETDLKARTARPGTNCYRDTDLFLLQNHDNPAH